MLFALNIKNDYLIHSIVHKLSNSCKDMSVRKLQQSRGIYLFLLISF